MTIDLIEEYKEVFSGLGKLRGVKVKLHVDPDAKGAVQKQRRISLPLKDKFDEILDKWEQMDIVEDVGDKPTEWCSNVVLTPKEDRENIRASLDMTDANKYIKGTRHAIPTLRELETRLNGAEYFSHLDMNDGYMQLELAEERRKPKLWSGVSLPIRYTFMAWQTHLRLTPTTNHWCHCFQATGQLHHFV